MSPTNGFIQVQSCVFFIALLTGVTAQPATTLKMASRVVEPLVIAREEGGKTVVDGFVKDLMAKVGSIVNRNFEISVMSNQSSLEVQTTAMLNQLEKGTVNVIGPLPITFVNERAVDFTKPILMSGIVPVWNPSLFSEDGDSYIFSWFPIPSKLFLVLKPFSTGVWLLSLFCFVGVSVFFYLIYLFNPRERKDNSILRTYDDDFSILGSFLFAFSSLVWQGYSKAPRSISGRVLAAFWWIFVLIFICCYTAKLVFFLTPTALITSNSGTDDIQGPVLNDLLGSEGVTFGVVKNSQEYYFFRQSRIKVYEDIWKSMNEDPDMSFVASPDDGLKKARTGRFIFLTNSLMARYAIGRGDCNLAQLGPMLSSNGVGLAVKTGSDFKEQLNLAVLELIEQGEIMKLQEKWWKNECDARPTSGRLMGRDTPRVPRVSVTEFAGAFILLVIGAVLAAIVLLLEILFTRRRKRKELQIEQEKPEETVMVETSAEPAKV